MGRKPTPFNWNPYKNPVITLPCGISGPNFCCAQNCPKGNGFKKIEICYNLLKKKQRLANGTKNK